MFHLKDVSLLLNGWNTDTQIAAKRIPTNTCQKKKKQKKEDYIHSSENCWFDFRYCLGIVNNYIGEPRFQNQSKKE